MRRKRELGYCSVTTTEGGGYLLERAQFDPVKAAWLKGCVFVDTIGFHGDRMTIRLSNVDSVSDVPPEAEVSALYERRADEADDSLAAGSV